MANPENLVTVAVVVTAAGIILAAIAAFKPSWLQHVPRMYWFRIPSFRAGRVTAFSVSLGCVVWGLTALGIIPKPAQIVAVVVVIIGLINGLADDIAGNKSNE